MQAQVKALAQGQARRKMALALNQPVDSGMIFPAARY
jgi:hypothetical protein